MWFFVNIMLVIKRNNTVVLTGLRNYNAPPVRPTSAYVASTVKLYGVFNRLNQINPNLL